MNRVNVALILITLVVVGLAVGCQPIQLDIPVQTANSEEEQIDALEESPGCPVFDRTTQQIVKGNSDPLALLLATSNPCPTNVFEFRARLLDDDAQIVTTMVANRGFHNPAFGSFSLFEMIEGDLDSIDTTVEQGEFFFGHFTAPDGSALIADQNPRPGRLMVELIVWDPVKRAFNFYELIGTGAEGVWVYNGDSFDVLEDLTLLHQRPNPNAPPLGSHLRCSGCHMAGGPIMKELASPHNDWWTMERGLNFGGRMPDAGLVTIVGENFSNLSDASELADGVLSGLEKLQASTAFQRHLDIHSLRERLRPLFCPVELNLESDLRPLDEDNATVQIPAAFFVDPRLAQGEVTIDKSHYRAALKKRNAKFPEIDRQDGDRAWETPVKATSDIMAVQTLVERGIIDEEFVFDVLAVDMSNPAISKERCGLLELVPNEQRPDWPEAFTLALEATKDENLAAETLLSFLTDPDKDTTFHQAQAQQLLTACQESLQDEESVAELFGLLAQKRAEVFASEISESPGGEILEPGFRVIFPDVTPKPQPWSLKLTVACQVVAVDGQ